MQLSAHGYESLHISLNTHLQQFTCHIDLMRFSRKEVLRLCDFVFSLPALEVGMCCIVWIYTCYLRLDFSKYLSSLIM